MSIFWCLAFLTVCIIFFLLFRNDWVYRKRVYLIFNNPDAYDKLPEYSTMIFKFWIWDINKFIPDDKTT